ncbi:hypothetical protein ACEN8K_43655, partial [Variovorax sp. CT11-76]
MREAGRRAAGIRRFCRARRAVFEALSLVAFALAVSAKEVALVYPLLLTLWEATRPGSTAGRIAQRVA